MFLNSLSERQLEKFSHWVRELFGYGVNVNRESGHISINLEYDNETVNIIDTGYGVSQILPVLGQIWWSINRPNTRGNLDYSNTILAIEQPELHLHPAHQSLLADALASGINLYSSNEEKSLSYVIETHSEAMINRIGDLIFKGSLKKDDIQVLIFESDRNDPSKTKIKTATFDDEGMLMDWPFGFFCAGDAEMIFSVEISPEEAAIMDEINLKNCLNRLLQAHRDGNIYLVFNRKNSLWFLTNIDLYPENESILNRILSQISTTSNLKNLAYHKVCIVYSALTLNSNINTKYIELDEKKIIELIKPPVIVVENLLNDGEVIKYICHNYMRKVNIRNISLDIHSGSGSQVLDTSKYHCQNGRITLAITDRDSIFPSSNKNIISYINDYYHYILPCHEVENLFGLNCIEKYKGINEENNRIS